MSDQEVLVSKRRNNRLSLDSEEEARVEAQEQVRQEEIRLRKEEKRRRREEEARKIEEEQKKREDLARHYEDPQTMLQPDSDSDDKFERAEKKVKRAFPEFKNREEHQNKRRHQSQSDESDSQQSSEEQSQSEEEQSSHKKKGEKRNKKEKKQKRRQDSEQIRAARSRVEKVKVQEKDPKQKLVSQIAIRWWYCLPEWPPADYDYESQLKKLGYRLVEINRFRMEENLVNGLYKATPIDGYVGIFKTKLKIIDIRPKDSCPSLQFLRGKSMSQLTSLLRVALKQQLSQLNSQSFLLDGDIELINELTRKLNQLSE